MQPDTIIPDYANPQAFNRYSYVTNRPVNFNDPTGHKLLCEDGDVCKHDNRNNGDKKNKSKEERDELRDEGGGGSSCISITCKLTNDVVIRNNGLDYKGCKQLGLSMSTCQTVISGLDGLVIGTDILGELISIVEWAFVGPPIVGGVAITLLLTIFQPEIIPELLAASPSAVVDFLAYDASLATFFAPFEDRLGYASLGMTTASDWLKGNTYIENGDWYLGEATVYSAGLAAAGTFPEANIDLAASTTQLIVDSSQGLGSINVSQFARNTTSLISSWLP